MRGVLTTSSNVSGRLADLAALRAQVRGLETGAPAAAIGLGDGALDAALPGGGLALGALHEAAPAAYLDAPATGGFLLGMASRALALRPGGLVWAHAPGGADFGLPYAPGLADLGLPAGRIVRVEARTVRDRLWVGEEAAGARGVGVVLIETEAALSLAASRRLQLAAARGGGLVLLWRPPSAVGASVARTRWTIAARPSAVPDWAAGAGLSGLAIPPGRPAWRVTLARARGMSAVEKTFDLEWSDATGGFCLAAPVADAAIGAGRAPLRARA